MDTQDFSAGGYEHEFSFDLSGNIDNEELSVYIAGVPAGASFLQAYAYPTGYSGTYGRNAEITFWDFSQVNLVDGGVNGIGRIRLENNPVTTLAGLEHIAAGEINFTNCQLDAETLADALIGIDNSGVLNGSFSYSGNLAAPAERALAAYNNLKDVKGWALTGEVPVDASEFEAETIAYMTEVGIPDDTNDSIYPNKTNKDVWVIMDDYFKELKANNLLSKFELDYSFIGGTGASHAINLKNPSSNKITWFGSIIHNALGVLFSGNGYGKTGYIPFNSNIESFTSSTTIIVSGTNNNPTSVDTYEYGAQNASGSNITTIKRKTGSGSKDGNISKRWNADHESTFQDALGVSAVVVDGSFFQWYKNGEASGGLINVTGSQKPNLESYIGTINLSGEPYSSGYTNQRIQGIIIASKLTAAELATLTTLINTREAALSRKTW
jgi:hypothetical protein